MGGNKKIFFAKKGHTQPILKYASDLLVQMGLHSHSAYDSRFRLGH